MLRERRSGSRKSSVPVSRAALLRSPIGDFLEFGQFRSRVSDPPGPADRWWSRTARVMRRSGLPVPDRKRVDAQALRESLLRLESALPAGLSELASDGTFIALLEGFGDTEARKSVRAQLTRVPLAEAFTEQSRREARDEEAATSLRPRGTGSLYDDSYSATETPSAHPTEHGLNVT